MEAAVGPKDLQLYMPSKLFGFLGTNLRSDSEGGTFRTRWGFSSSWKILVNKFILSPIRENIKCPEALPREV